MWRTARTTTSSAARRAGAVRSVLTPASTSAASFSLPRGSAFISSSKSASGCPGASASSKRSFGINKPTPVRTGCSPLSQLAVVSALQARGACVGLLSSARLYATVAPGEETPAKKQRKKPQTASGAVGEADGAELLADTTTLTTTTTATTTTRTKASAAVATTTTTTTIKSKKKKPANPVISRWPLRPVLADQHKYVKLISWNVFSLNSIVEKGSLQHYIKEEEPDVLCLQETKLTHAKIERFKGKTFHRPDIYQYEFHNCSTAIKGYSGVAMYSKYRPLRVHHGIGVEEHDNEGRVITLEFAGFYLVGSYIPNSGDELKRLEYRQRWNRDMDLLSLSTSGLKAGLDVHPHGHELEYRVLDESERRGKPVIWCGDLNVAHEEIDLHDPANNHYTSGFTDEERDDFTRVIKTMDFVDSYRHENPTRQSYSFWSYRSAARARNMGWRLDYFMYQRALAPYVRKAFIRNFVLGSDHCPVGLLLDPALFQESNK